MPGQTSYYGWKEYAKAKAVCFLLYIYFYTIIHCPMVRRGRLCLCLLALGPLEGEIDEICTFLYNNLCKKTHSMVIQLAKQDGLKVIASAGSDEKVKFCREIGADVAFNYKTTNTAEVLKNEGPIDM